MATFNFNKVNLAAAQIPSAITASQTSITVDASESALFPTVPFFATIMPAGGVPNTLNSEIVQVTAVNTSTGVLTITRAQRSTTAKAQDEGAVIMNGVYIEDLAQAQAVGLAFFSATNVSVSSSYSYWNIDNAMLPTTPTNGMSIRVVFGADTSSPSAQLRLNGGTYKNVYAGVGLTATASNVNTTTPFNPKSGIIYELVYYNNAWYAMNVPANNSITSDNVDWATFGGLVYAGRVGFNKRTYSNGYMYLQNKQDLYAATGVSSSLTNGNLYLTFTLPSGQFVADVQSTLWVGSNTWDYMWLKNEKNGTEFSNSMGPKAGAWAFVNTRGVTKITNGDNLRAYLATAGNNFSDGNMADANSFMQVLIYRTG